MTVELTVLDKRAERRTRLRQQLRILRVLAGVEYKIKYAESALGYVWSVAKPLAMFAVLYTVFGRFFKLNTGFDHYPIYLLIGIVMWNFFADATSASMTSLVARESLLRKLSFPYLVIPASITVSVAITFFVNLLVVGVFIAANEIAPSPSWLLIPFLLVELVVFTAAVGLVLATAFVRLRDVHQVWELALQLLFFGSPIIYPVGFLPGWAQPIAFLNPVVQVMQDVRTIVISGPAGITTADVYGSAWGYLAPFGFCAATIVFSLWLFRREAPWFAERV